VSRRARQMASLKRRWRAAAVARRRQGAVLPFTGIQIDGCSRDHRKKVRFRPSDRALPGDSPASKLTFGPVRLRCDPGWTAIPDQYASEECRNAADDGGVELGRAIEEEISLAVGPNCPAHPCQRGRAQFPDQLHGPNRAAPSGLKARAEAQRCRTLFFLLMS